MERIIMSPKHFNDMMADPYMEVGGNSYRGINVTCEPYLPDHMSPMVLKDGMQLGGIPMGPPPGISAMRPGHVVYEPPICSPWDDIVIPCSHEWKADMKSIFINKTYYSCARCGKKQEDL